MKKCSIVAIRRAVFGSVVVGGLVGTIAIGACSSDSDGVSFPEGGAPFIDGSLDAYHRVDDAATDGKREDASSEGPLDIDVRAAATSATVVGQVEDESGQPLTATVAIGAAMGTSDADGRFSLVAPTGHQTMRVEAPGYVPLLLPVGIVGLAEPMVVRLATKNASSSIPPGGATISSNGAELSFAAGTYATNTNVSMTYLTNILVAPGVPGFTDETGTGYRIRGVVHVEAATQPGQPVVLRVPVSAGLTANDVRLSALGSDGYWEAPIAPTSVNGGFATYAVSHFSDYAQGEKGAPHVVVARVVGAVRARPRGDVERFAVVGDRLPLSTSYFSTSTGYWSITLVSVPSGDVLTFSNPNGEGTADDPVTTISEKEGEVDIETTCPKKICPMSYGLVKKPSKIEHPALKYMIRPRNNAVMGVRGTVARMTVTACEDASRATIDVEVPEGQVDLTSEGRSTNLSGKTSFCFGCASPKEAACCWLDPDYDSFRPCPASGVVYFDLSTKAVCPDGTKYEASCAGGACSCRKNGNETGTCTYGPSCPSGADYPPLVTSATCCNVPPAVVNALMFPRCRDKNDCPSVFSGCSATPVRDGHCTL